MKQQMIKAAAFALILGLGACKVSKDIKTPAAQLPDQYRSASTGAAGSVAAADTTSVGDLPWKNFFTDPELQQLIDSAIVRNYDMQVALQNIKSAQLVLGQSKLGYWPDVTVQATATLTRPSDNSLNGITASDFLGSKFLND